MSPSRSLPAQLGKVALLPFEAVDAALRWHPLRSALDRFHALPPPLPFVAIVAFIAAIEAGYGTLSGRLF